MSAQWSEELMVLASFTEDMLQPWYRGYQGCNRETTAPKRCRLENVPDVSAYLALMSVLQILHRDVCKGLEWVL